MLRKYSVAIVLTLALSVADAAARGNGREPCDRGAGGVSHCENGRFICNNGTVSRSKRVCVAPQKQGKAIDTREKGKRK